MLLHWTDFSIVCLASRTWKILALAAGNGERKSYALRLPPADSFSVGRSAIQRGRYAIRDGNLAIEKFGAAAEKADADIARLTDEIAELNANIAAWSRPAEEARARALL